MKINLLLVGGRKMTREGLVALLRAHKDLSIVGEAEDVAAAAKLATALSAHVAVLLVGQFSSQLAERIRTLRTQAKSLRIVVMLMQSDAAVLRQALGAGAAGCLIRDSSSGELVAAIRAVHAGQIFLSPKATHQVINNFVLRDRPSTALSVREREVVRRIANGESTKEIARHLGVGVKTAETHRRRAMEKLGVHSVAGLTKYALSQGITSLDQPTSV